MALLYTFSIRIYVLLLLFISRFNLKAKAWVEGRKKYWENIPELPTDSPLYWFHCASLGEFDQGIPVMNLMKEKDPSILILVTFFSPSGMEHYHKRKHVADYVYYLPIDTPQNAKRFLNHFKPKQIYFVKYEFWLNYIFEAKKRNIPLYSISCILRPSHIFFKWYGGYFRKGLRAFTHFYVQNVETLELLQKIGILDVTVTGDTRFDKVIQNKILVQPDQVIEDFLNGTKAIILGSSWQIEENLFYTYYTKNDIQNKVIIAPHDISESHLKFIENLFENGTIRYSNYHSGSVKNILLIDCIGKLANAYSYGKYAFIGGGFTGKLHNTLEPVVFGLPVLFGPKHSKFPEAQQFIDAGIGFSITSSDAFASKVVEIEQNLIELQKRCSEAIEKSKGASERILLR